MFDGSFESLYHAYLPIYYLRVLSRVFSGLVTAMEVYDTLKAAFAHGVFVAVVI